MRPLKAHTGRGVTLRRSDVDTDQIIPAGYCKRLTKTGYADGLFAGWRADPQFVLNQPAAAGASVLIGWHNFGTGSSREHAVWALRDGGFAAVIAVSFGDIFLRNAWKNGVPAVRLPAEAVSWLADRTEADPSALITVDVAGREVRAGERRFPYPVDDRARRLVLDGLDDMDLTLLAADRIAAYEHDRPYWLPRLSPDAVANRLSRLTGPVPA
ncbi:3-isopropylmalate dehydratase small subunit [Actinoplanes sp. N902-109]|uniref:3-isopropylmalate dehydratase small subunit n=1 Tax=Actinoplanes sp. (strain N902-109) TaxID=649831 RepID=UPI000329441D|nr:3-isopropylmalate dehydratase small subunit [Actinoplanes sp. N902-109]AGL19075.1 3-isopropylmalate dehydratase small subunit [Actinoplanes sp. N902-109]